jgi:hypothetical protein
VPPTGATKTPCARGGVAGGDGPTGIKPPKARPPMRTIPTHATYSSKAIRKPYGDCHRYCDSRMNPASFTRLAPETGKHTIETHGHLLVRDSVQFCSGLVPASYGRSPALATAAMTGIASSTGCLRGSALASVGLRRCRRCSPSRSRACRRLPPVMYTDDVGMPQACGQVGFADKPLPE